MELRVKEERIKNIAEIFRLSRSYPDNQARWSVDSRTMYKRLLELPDTRTEDDIARIIGNKTWTECKCDECQNNRETVVIFKNVLSALTFKVCRQCLMKAFSLNQQRYMQEINEQS